MFGMGTGVASPPSLPDNVAVDYIRCNHRLWNVPTEVGTNDKTRNVLTEVRTNVYLCRSTHHRCQERHRYTFKTG